MPITRESNGRRPRRIEGGRGQVLEWCDVQAFIGQDTNRGYSVVHSQHPRWRFDHLFHGGRWKRRMKAMTANAPWGPPPPLFSRRSNPNPLPFSFPSLFSVRFPSATCATLNETYLSNENTSTRWSSIEFYENYITISAIFIASLLINLWKKVVSIGRNDNKKD